MTDTHISERYEFRNIKQNEAEEAAEIERICFPPNEACSKKHMKDRVAGIADLFLVVIDKENGKMAGFLNGLATDEVVLKDEFFTDAGLHNPEGKNIMLLGLDVLPEYRSKCSKRSTGSSSISSFIKNKEFKITSASNSSSNFRIIWWHIRTSIIWNQC